MRLTKIFPMVSTEGTFLQPGLNEVRWQPPGIPVRPFHFHSKVNDHDLDVLTVASIRCGICIYYGGFQDAREERFREGNMNFRELEEHSFNELPTVHFQQLLTLMIRNHSLRAIWLSRFDVEGTIYMTQELCTLAKWEKQSPHRQGFLLYMEEELPGSPLKGLKNPYAQGSDEDKEFKEGQQQAVLLVQDIDE